MVYFFKIFPLKQLVSAFLSFSFFFKMESACPIILNSTNFFQWLTHMVDILRSKGLYRIATGQETKPSDNDKAAKWENKQDQARGLI